MDAHTWRAPRSGRRSLAVLAGFLIVCFSVAAAGGIVTATSVGTWYQELVKPPFNPPEWVFPPVWNTLFLMIAIAGWRVWRCADWAEIRVALALYFVQLALNLGWSVLFFGFQEVGWAMADLIVLWGLIAVTAVMFWRIDRLAGAFLIPYLAWVTFAGVLNGYILAAN